MSKYLNFKDDYTGISQQKAQENKSLYGENSDYAITRQKDGFNIFKLFIKPIFILLIITGGFYFYNGNIDASVISVVLAIIYAATETFRSTFLEDKLAEIIHFTQTEYRVIRDDQLVLVSKHDIVPDDILVIQSGENIPADAHLLEVRNLVVDESLLSNKKELVIKTTGFDSQNDLKTTMVYSGTRVIRGSAVCRVVATGIDTKRYLTYGPLEAPSEYTSAPEAVAKKTAVYTTAISFVMLLVVFLLALFSNLSLDNSTINVVGESGILASLIALSFTPVEIAAIIRIYYIFGAQKLAKKHSLIKSLEVIDNLNSMSVLCVDKTDSVIKAKTEVVDVYAKNHDLIVNIAALSSEKSSMDIVEQAINLYTTFHNADTSGEFSNELIAQFPFSPYCRLSGNLWDVKGVRLLCIKGTPEEVFPLCDFKGNDLFEAQQFVANATSHGYTAIAIAFATLNSNDEVPQTLSEKSYHFVGVMTFANETRESVPYAIRQLQKSGLRVVMLTGDSPEAATAIGKKIGINASNVITGAMLEDENLNVDLNSTDVFARLNPYQKVKLIDMLKASGETVGITGGKVSDTALLEAAHVGITVLQGSTGAAHDASDLMMNDDNLITVMETIKTSRIVHKNIKTAVSLIISLTMTLILSSVVPLLFGNSPAFSPLTTGIIQVVLIPTLSLLYALIDNDLKTELLPSNFIGHGRINKFYFVKAISQGLGITLAVFFGYFFLMSDKQGTISKSSSFLIFVMASALLTWVNVNDKGNVFRCLRTKYIKGIILSSAVVAFGLLVIYMPYINTILGFTAIDLIAIIMCFITSCVFCLWWELLKFWWNRKLRKGNQ